MWEKHKDKIILAVLVILFALASAFCSKTEAADRLGPDAQVTFYSIVPAVTIIDNEIQPTVTIEARHSWHPFDLVGEVVLREQPSVNLLLAKGFGDTRILGGVGLQAGASNPSWIFGADHNHLRFRIGNYKSTSTVTVPGTCRRWRCRPDTTTTTSRNHSAITVGWAFQFGAR